MFRIELDGSLKPYERESRKSVPELCERLTDKKTDYRTNVTTQTLFPAWLNVPGDAAHLGYVEYLEHCWAWHHGVVLSPDAVWQTLLGEVASIIGATPEDYRTLFTDSAEKKNILVQGVPEDPSWTDRVMNELRVLVPTDTSAFLPLFSTTGQGEWLARHAMFLQAVSPFYSYSVFCCGIPRVEVRGTPEDWLLLADRWGSLGKLFGPGEHGPYFRRTNDLIDRLVAAVRADATESTRSFFRQMFVMERCGSGSQKVASGWFTELFREKPSLPLSRNFPTGLARVDFRDVSRGVDYQSTIGYLSSRPTEDGFREPLVGHVLMRKRA